MKLIDLATLVRLKQEIDSTVSEVGNSIGPLDSLTTDRKTSIVAAINELKSADANFMTTVDWDEVAGKPSWIGASKPSYAMSEVSVSAQTVAYSPALSIDYSLGNIAEVTLTGNVTSILPQNIADGHQLHVFLKAAASNTASVSVSIGSAAGALTLPDSASDISLSIAPGGYAEVNFLRVGNNIYVRGV